MNDTYNDNNEQLMAQELERQKKLNVNLLRICKERANASRGIVPKKQNSGYVLKYSNQIKRPRASSVTADDVLAKGIRKPAVVKSAWKSLIETPYNTALPLDLLEPDILRELPEALSCFGISHIQPKEKNGEFRTWKDGDTETNGIYRWDFSCNYRTGFWELTVCHTLPLHKEE